MNLLIDERQKKQSQAEQALEAERQRAAELARQVDNLKDLIAKLEVSARQRRPRNAHAAARSAEDGSNRPDARRAQGSGAARAGGRVSPPRAASCRYRLTV